MAFSNEVLHIIKEHLRNKDKITDQGLQRLAYQAYCDGYNQLRSDLHGLLGTHELAREVVHEYDER